MYLKINKYYQKHICITWKKNMYSTRTVSSHRGWKFRSIWDTIIIFFIILHFLQLHKQGTILFPKINAKIYRQFYPSCETEVCTSYIPLGPFTSLISTIFSVTGFLLLTYNRTIDPASFNASTALLCVTSRTSTSFTRRIQSLTLETATFMFSCCVIADWTP